ncbi:MAG TPA: hypothetical protein VFF69_00210 [Phycisphaerales bacterium]|nr:hypothetical protein [Phycisphaerales bacterium]
MRSTPDQSQDSAQQPGRRLRLAEDVDHSPRAPSSASDARARTARVRQDRQVHRAWEVGAENRAAAAISSFDARWVMAARVSDALEGGRAAILRPEARSRLVSGAGRMGLRPFDANMVIAIVQDAARRGESPLDSDGADRLTLVGRPDESARRRPVRQFVVAIVLAVLWAGVLLRWLIG